MFGSRWSSAEAPPHFLPTALVCLAIAFAPLTVVIGSAGGDPDLRPLVFVGDIPAAAAAVAVGLRLVRTGRRPPTPVLVLFALVVWMAMALAVNPSLRGVLFTARVGASAAIAAWVAVERTARRPVAITLGAVVAIQAAIGVLQVTTGGPLGLHGLGEATDPLWSFGTVEAPQGTMGHPYVLAGWAAVAAATVPTPAIVAGVATVIGMTFSRAGALAAVGSATLLVAARRQRAVAAALALVLGFGLAATARSEGWRARVDQTTGARSEAALTTERGDLAEQAMHLVGDRPLAGVGPGSYVRVLTEERPDLDVVKPVHSVPLLVAAETGVVGGALAAAVLFTAAGTAWRGGGRRRAVFFAWLPFVLLDHFPYDFQQGLLLTGLWLGLVSQVHEEVEPQQVDDGGTSGRRDGTVEPDDGH